MPFSSLWESPSSDMFGGKECLAPGHFEFTHLAYILFCIKGSSFSSQQCCKYYLVCLPPVGLQVHCLFQYLLPASAGGDVRKATILSTDLLLHNPTNKRLSMCGTLDWSVRLPEEIIVQEKNILKLCEIPLIQKFKGKNLTWVLLTGNPKFLPTFPVSRYVLSHILKSKIFSPDYLG